MKKLVLAIALLLLVNTAAWAATFVNGGFEDGDWTGWTKNGGSYYSSGYTWTGDPGKSAIVTPGTDPYTANNLNRVYNGSYSARVNNYDGGFHFSTISQTVTNWTDPKIYFAWAAVLQNPGHAYAGHLRITLTDDTLSSTLYDVAFDYFTAPGYVSWLDGASGWKYNDWVVEELDIAAANQGNDLTLTLLASDCGYGAHGGYAYLDGFGAAPPPQGGIPEPMSMTLFGIGLLGAGYLRKRK